MTKSNKNSSSSNNKKKKRSCVNKGNNFWYAHCKRFRDDDKNRYESAAHYTRHESSEGLNEKDTRVFQMKLNAYDKKVLKPDNRHRRRKWSVVEEGLMRVVRHSPKDSFLTASGRPDFSKLRKAAKQVVEEKIVNHPELAGFKTRKEWFVDAVESNPNLFQLSQSVACQEAEVGGSEDGAAEQDKDEPVQIVDRIKVPKHVMDEFGTIVIVDWRGKGVPGIISDPREGSPEAKKIWVEMYDKHASKGESFWKNPRLETRLVYWPGEKTYSLVAKIKMSLPLSSESLVVLGELSKSGGRVAPFSSDRSLILPSPKRVAKRKIRQQAQKSKRWKRVSTRPYDAEIREAKGTYRNHTDTYSHTKIGKHSPLLDELPIKGLESSNFPTCMPKKLPTKELRYGLVAMEPIGKSYGVGEYIGEFCTSEPSDTTYLMKYREGVWIDARVSGNFMRFINHSCNPNAKAEIIFDEGHERVIIVATEDIEKGDFITIKYSGGEAPLGYEKDGTTPRPCLCGSADCISKK